MDNYQYFAYSKVSETELKSENELDKIINLNNEIKRLKLLHRIKKYIIDKYNIKDSISNFSVCNGGYLSVSDNEYAYTVNLKFDNKDISYSFCKVEEKM